MILKKPLFWITLIIIAAIVWFALIGRQKTMAPAAINTPTKTSAIAPENAHPAKPTLAAQDTQAKTPEAPGQNLNTQNPNAQNPAVSAQQPANVQNPNTQNLAASAQPPANAQNSNAQNANMPTPQGPATANPAAHNMTSASNNNNPAAQTPSNEAKTLNPDIQAKAPAAPSDNQTAIQTGQQALGDTPTHAGSQTTVAATTQPQPNNLNGTQSAAINSDAVESTTHAAATDSNNSTPVTNS